MVGLVGLAADVGPQGGGIEEVHVYLEGGGEGGLVGGVGFVM